MAACLGRLSQMVTHDCKHSHANVPCKTHGTYSHGSKSCGERRSAKELVDGSHGSSVADCYFWKQVHIQSHQVLQHNDTVSCAIAHQYDYHVCDPSLEHSDSDTIQPDQENVAVITRTT